MRYTKVLVPDVTTASDGSVMAFSSTLSCSLTVTN